MKGPVVARKGQSYASAIQILKHITLAIRVWSSPIETPPPDTPLALLASSFAVENMTGTASFSGRSVAQCCFGERLTIKCFTSAESLLPTRRAALSLRPTQKHHKCMRVMLARVAAETPVLPEATVSLCRILQYSFLTCVAPAEIGLERTFCHHLQSGSRHHVLMSFL